MPILWFSPLGLMHAPTSPSDVARVRIVPHGAPNTAVRLTAAVPITDPSLEWVQLALPMPAMLIRDIKLHYAVTSAMPGRTYLSQTRLTVMTMPNAAQVRFDDPTNLTSTTPTAYSRACQVSVDGALTLSLRVVIGDPADQILLGAIALTTA